MLWRVLSLERLLNLTAKVTPSDLERIKTSLEIGLFKMLLELNLKTAFVEPLAVGRCDRL